MSAKLMGQVWGLAVPRCEREVLLALADHSDDHGRGARPSVGYLAWKTDFSDRQVQRAINDLKVKGILEVEAHAKGGRGHQPEYRLRLDLAPRKRPWEEIREERRAARRKGDTVSPIPDPTPAGMGDAAMSPIDGEKDDTTSPFSAERVTSATQMGDISDTKRVTFGAERVTSATSSLYTEPFKEEPSIKNHQGGGAPVSDAATATAPPPDADELTPGEIAEGKRIRSALAAWLGLDLRTLRGKLLERLNDESKALARIDISAEDLAEFRERWFREHWAGGNREKSDRDRRPSLDQAIEWVAWCRGEGAKSDGAAIHAAVAHGHALAAGDAPSPEPMLSEVGHREDAGDLADLWAQVLASLRLQMVRSTFESWYEKTRLQALTDDGVAVVEVHSDHARAWLADRDRGVLTRLLAEAGMEVNGVVFVEAQEIAAMHTGRAA